MTTLQATGYQLASQFPGVLTCTNHPTVIGDHKCGRCQKIICLQCYTRWGPNTGVCPQCYQFLSQRCCNIV